MLSFGFVHNDLSSLDRQIPDNKWRKRMTNRLLNINGKNAIEMEIYSIDRCTKTKRSTELAT